MKSVSLLLLLMKMKTVSLFRLPAGPNTRVSGNGRASPSRKMLLRVSVHPLLIEAAFRRGPKARAVPLSVFILVFVSLRKTRRVKTRFRSLRKRMKSAIARRLVIAECRQSVRRMVRKRVKRRRALRVALSFTAFLLILVALVARRIPLRLFMIILICFIVRRMLMMKLRLRLLIQTLSVAGLSLSLSSPSWNWVIRRRILIRRMIRSRKRSSSTVRIRASRLLRRKLFLMAMMPRPTRMKRKLSLLRIRAHGSLRRVVVNRSR